jgi:hypothetical protein
MVALGAMMMTPAKRAAAHMAGISVLLLSACATTQEPTLYRWGAYEQLIYEMYAKVGASPRACTPISASCITSRATQAQPITNLKANAPCSRNRRFLLTAC